MIEAFLESPAGKDMLERVVRIGGVAAAAFHYSDGGEENSISLCGTCAQSCAYVSKTPWGVQACRKSRKKAVDAAVRRNKPVPFICHMGFSNVAVQAETGSRSNAIILGPYYPDNIPPGEDADLVAGLKKLDARAGTELPFAVDDVPRVNADAVPALAEWVRDAISDRYALSNQDEFENQDDIEAKSTSNSKHARSSTGTDDAKALLAALVSGDGKRAGRIIDDVLGRPARKASGLLGVQRSRCLMLVATVLSEAESGGLDTSKCWTGLERVTATITADSDPATWRKSILLMLRPLRRLPAKGNSGTHDFALLDNLLDEHLATGITLAEAARKLNQNPTTISKRLQRDFGMSYSDYVGRLRVDRAKHLFGTTALSVGEVARRVGLNDSSNFSKLFKKHAGKTPADFRRQLQATGKR